MSLRNLDGDPIYEALFQGDYRKYNQLMESHEGPIDLSFTNLSNVSLMRIHSISRVILTGARLKMSDLRGLDLSEHNLEGVSIQKCQISGTYFPPDISAQEILLSLETGTRLRHSNPQMRQEAQKRKSQFDM